MIQRIWSENASGGGNVRIPLESKKFRFDEKALEIDGLLMTKDGLLLVECKSYVKSQDIEDLKAKHEKCLAYATRFGVNEDASQHLCSKRIECVLFCDYVPSNVLQEIKKMKIKIHIVVSTGEGYNLHDAVVEKRGRPFP